MKIGPIVCKIKVDISLWDIIKLKLLRIKPPKDTEVKIPTRPAPLNPTPGAIQMTKSEELEKKISELKDEIINRTNEIGEIKTYIVKIKEELRALEIQRGEV